jgi:hypothetical protein
MTDATLPKDEGFVCADCRNVFLQPPRCTTCGAEKLYDATVRNLQEDVVRYENGRVILTHMIETLTAERDTFKQIAELNANTIKCMQAAVNLHAHRIDEIYEAKS